MRANYTNLPSQKTNIKTKQEFQGYQNLKPSTDPSVYNAMVGFFTSRGFDSSSAELITETIMFQARTDGYSSQQIIDSMKSLNSLEISSIVAEILNYNRFKSSSLGYRPEYQSNPEVSRNIIA